jgi:hypothetical protein
VDVNPISSRHRPFITRTSSDVSDAHHAIAQTLSAPLVSALLDEQERAATPEREVWLGHRGRQPGRVRDGRGPPPRPLLLAAVGLASV